MTDGVVQKILEEGSENAGGPNEAIVEILSKGEEIGEDNRNRAIFVEESNYPQLLVKFYGDESVDDVRDRIENSQHGLFPETEVYVCNTNWLNNEDIETWQRDRNSVVAVQTRSDGSYLKHEENYENARDRIVGFVDDLVRADEVIFDFKTEEIHRYGDELRYVDFADKEEDLSKINGLIDTSDESFPETILKKIETLACKLGRNLSQRDYQVGQESNPYRGTGVLSSDLKESIAKMYADVAVNLSRKYGKDLEDVKSDVAEISEHISEGYYDDNGFTPDMIGECPDQ